MAQVKLCEFPVEVNTEAPEDRVVVHPKVLIKIEEKILRDSESFRALKSLYHALVEMSESGIGYSPKTSDAMKKLKEFPYLQPAPKFPLSR